MTLLRRSAHPDTPHARSRRAGALLRRCRLVLVLLLATGTVAACLPDPVPWSPSEEDTGPDSGPDLGTCEHRRDCGRAVK